MDSPSYPMLVFQPIPGAVAVYTPFANFIVAPRENVITVYCGPAAPFPRKVGE